MEKKRRFSPLRGHEWFTANHVVEGEINEIAGIRVTRMERLRLPRQVRKWPIGNSSSTFYTVYNAEFLEIWTIFHRIKRTIEWFLYAMELIGSKIKRSEFHL